MRRERAIAEIKEIIADGCSCDRNCEQLVGADVYCGCLEAAEKAVAKYEEIMAEPDDQPSLPVSDRGVG